MYIPRASLMTLTMFGSLDSGPVSGLFSSAFNLFFWLYNSNSTLRKPMQYRRIPNAEMMVEKEGKLCFWGAIFNSSFFESCSSDKDLVRELVSWYSLLFIIIFCHIEKRQRSTWFRHWSVSCKLIFASGWFSSVRVSLGWIHYNYKLCKEFSFSGYWDWPEGILRSRLTFVKHAAGTQSGRGVIPPWADFLFKKKGVEWGKKTTSNSFVFWTFFGGGGDRGSWFCT